MAIARQGPVLPRRSSVAAKAKRAPAAKPKAPSGAVRFSKRLHVHVPAGPVASLRQNDIEATDVAFRRSPSPRPDRGRWRTAIPKLDRGRIRGPRLAETPDCRHRRGGTAGSCFAQHVSRRLKVGGFGGRIEGAPAVHARADGMRAPSTVLNGADGAYRFGVERTQFWGATGKKWYCAL
jgi:hypothetical protein